MNLFKSTKAITYISSRGDKVYPIIMDIKTGIVEGDAVFTTGDIDTAYLYATILEEQSDYNILGSTVICNIQRPDGTTMKVQGDVLGNNLIEFPLGQSGVSQEGIYNFDIAVVFSEKKMVTSPTAQYSVTQSIEVIGEIEEDDRFPVLESLISELKVIKDEELVRVSNEEDRLANETVRQNQEVIRKNQEQARVTAEGNRVTSENVRVSAEQARVLKEQERQGTEVERQNSESTREQQEATRVSQENARKQADILRQQEHESRQQFLNGFEGKLNTVVDDVAGIKDDVVSVREANKRQDVFLQGLYNENLDGRVTVKEEGSVISLTNSADGLVDIVGLEGNTLVNYIQDGAKELTLNNEINAEGTSVTLTEGADNGLVDVVCEGNTLVNLVEPVTPIKTINNKDDRFYYLKQSYRLTNSKVYTLIFSISDCQSSTGRLNLVLRDGQDVEYYKNIYTNNLANGVCKFLIDSHIFNNNSSNDILISSIYFVHNGSEEPINTITLSNPLLLEGDWSNKEIPPYFEGMKSVAECEDNKIEILSRNGNVTNISGYEVYNDGYYFKKHADKANGYIVLDKAMQNINYTIHFTFKKNYVGTQVLKLYEVNENNTILNEIPIITQPLPGGEYEGSVTETFAVSTESKLVLGVHTGNALTFYLKDDVNISIGEKIIDGVKENKLEITLSEPLRALPNGVKDKIVKIGGKWYVERNCGSVVLDGSEGWTQISLGSDTYIAFQTSVSGIKNDTVIYCNKFIHKNIWGKDGECIWYNNFNYLQISILQASLNTLTIDEFKQWLSQNPTTVVYQLKTPTYEELPTDLTVNTYNDITHISNNSTIPCNMKVTNTGYNAIIKPSTQYTVAFDTNKSGEVGINLGGSKVTTNNNVATITTPSTLTDDTLRLTGKGIKASKVRLLEGDKTNCMPSYFEGLQSSFEEQVEENKYKIEILSKTSKNLYDLKTVNHDWGGGTMDIIINPNDLSYHSCEPFDISHLRGKTIYAGMFREGVLRDNGVSYAVVFDEEGYKIGNRFDIGSKGYLVPNNAKYMRLMQRCGGNSLSWIDKDKYVVKLEPFTSGEKLVKHKSNKIKLLINEPLRGVGDVKDRFVFNKDGKLMIERNCGTQVLTGKESWNVASQYELDSSIVLTSTVLGTNYPLKVKGLQYGRCSKFCNGTYATNNPTVNSVCLMDNHKGIRFRVHKTLANNVAEWCEYLKNNNLEYIYPLAEPTYEEVPYELQKIILEGYINGTLFLDTNIPPTVEASYTANIPVVSELNKNSNEIGLTQEDLSVTQVAVDFLLMSNIGEEMLSSFNLNTRGRNSMGAYFANRITKGALKYEDVISKYPQYKEEIDSILETK